MIVNGHYAGDEGVIEAIDVDAFSVTVRLRTGRDAARDVRGLEYECVRTPPPPTPTPSHAFVAQLVCAHS